MDTSKPFIGYKSAGRRPERNNDREGAKGAPLAAIRGWIAGTAGLPGDLEGLVRMLPSIDRKDPVLPTSDFYKEWLPLRGESPVERAFTEAGSLTGGAGVGSAARGVERGVSAGARGALSAIEAAARNAAVPRTLSPQAGVIKMKGGNWLDGSVEDALRGLKRPEGNMARQMEAIHGQRIAPIPEADRADALNDWIDKKLARYVRNEMATPEDPVRALAERGVLHVNPEQLNFRPEMHGKYLDLGQTADAKSPAAKVWEGASDNTVGYGPAKRWLGEVDDWVQDIGPSEEVASNSWLAKVPPDTRVHYLSEPRNFSDDLGFPHLIDELRNAVNPESGLPRELLLKYDALDRVTVPQAVERVSKINEWRAAQKAEADMVKANNAATVLHKEYPEGYRWVELKAPPLTVDTLPNGFEFRTMRNNQGGEYFSLRDLEDGGREVSAGLTPEAALKSAGARVNTQSYLEDALKYEGDTMGHCVGGYCDDVASGESRIYSLRDKKGQPHTTIEVRPKETSAYNRWLAAQEDPKAYTEFTDWWSAHTAPGQLGDLNTSFARWAEGKGVVIPEDTPSIVQIKGKQNKAPNPEYLPYVQDFVRSGKWSDVGDLSNTGLIGIDRESDMAAAFSKLGKEPPRYVTQDELTNLLKWNRGESPLPEGFARGGAVNVHDYDPNRVDALVQALEAELK